ncbi:MAG: hypothetical protein HBSAPP03_05220 [Phycisphaerae bacterium]|nr:MAG: hypothetical protein HBSAPP03_05220 [Phycisphaerae bacterium]
MGLPRRADPAVSGAMGAMQPCPAAASVDQVVRVAPEVRGTAAMVGTAVLPQRAVAQSPMEKTEERAGPAPSASAARGATAVQAERAWDPATLEEPVAAAARVGRDTAAMEVTAARAGMDHRALAPEARVARPGAIRVAEVGKAERAGMAGVRAETPKGRMEAPEPRAAVLPAFPV